MTNIPPATGLSDNEKEYNWTIMLPMIILGWSAIGAILYRPDLFIRFCQLICCNRQLAEVPSSNDSRTLTMKIAQDLGKLEEDGWSGGSVSSTSNKQNGETPDNSPSIKGQYVKLQDDPARLTI